MTADQNITSSVEALDSLLRVTRALRAVGAVTPEVRRELDDLADWIDRDPPNGYQELQRLEQSRRECRAGQSATVA